MKKQLLFYLIPLACALSGNGASASALTGGVCQAADSTAYTATPRDAAPAAYSGYRLVWSDEFNTDGKPSADWSAERGFVRNNELQWYQADNATVSGGCLVIEARRERKPNPGYEEGSKDWRRSRQYAEITSSSLTTAGKREFMYGRFEVRAKIPVDAGSWPAIWLLGNKWEWPQNGEIDILEFYISEGTRSILANACWGGTQRWNAVWDSSVTPLWHFLAKDSHWADKFHLWRMDWDSKFIRIYLDDELLNEIDLSKTVNRGFGGNTENPFSNSEKGFGAYLLLNLAVGGNGGEPDLSCFPLRYYVDYVRVYQPL